MWWLLQDVVSGFVMAPPVLFLRRIVCSASAGQPNRVPAQAEERSRPDKPARAVERRHDVPVQVVEPQHDVLVRVVALQHDVPARAAECNHQLVSAME